MTAPDPVIPRGADGLAHRIPPPTAEVVVTACGVWSAAGTTPDALWNHAAAGHVPAGWHAFGPRRALACVAPEPPPFPAFPQARRMDRSVRLALAAATPAVAEAQLDRLDPTRVAVLVGNSRGPASQWTPDPGVRIRPTQAAHSAIASLSGALSLAFRFRGPCLTLSATCASAAHAIAFGQLLLRAGAVDAVLAGGAEAPLVPALLDQFEAAGLLAASGDPATACRPFDRDRTGIVPGEGAAFLVLETADHARGRGLPVLARLAGAALGAESHNRVAARADGAGPSETMAQALSQAGLTADQIGHVNAHGTGTRVNDTAEAAALHRVFGSRLRDLAVTSTKPVTGHTFGATAALEAVLAIEALRRHLAPPTAGFATADPALGLVPVHGAPRPFAASCVLSASLGFWGNTAALIFAR